MSKSNKQFRTIDEKHHHVFKAKKKQNYEKTIKTIDRTLKNKKFDNYNEMEEEEVFSNNHFY